MRRLLATSIILLAGTGCRGEFEIRKDPDLWQVDPRQARRLEAPRVDPGYIAQVSDRSSWQIHTSLHARDALTDNDLTTLSCSQDDHRQGEFILVDLGCVCSFQMVRQVHPSGSGQPPRFRVDTAGDHGFPYTLQFLGTGQPHETLAIFTRPVKARFIKITVIEDAADPWCVAELAVE
jgi:hypothetical protein